MSHAAAMPMPRQQKSFAEMRKRFWEWIKKTNFGYSALEKRVNPIWWANHFLEKRAEHALEKELHERGKIPYNTGFAGSIREKAITGIMERDTQKINERIKAQERCLYDVFTRLTNSNVRNEIEHLARLEPPADYGFSKIVFLNPQEAKTVQKIFDLRGRILAESEGLVRDLWANYNKPTEKIMRTREQLEHAAEQLRELINENSRLLQRAELEGAAIRRYLEAAEGKKGARK